jgi:hypothetical protein
MEFSLLEHIGAKNKNALLIAAESLENQLHLQIKH